MEKGPLSPVPGVSPSAPNWGAARRDPRGLDLTPLQAYHETKHLLSKAADKSLGGPLGMCHPAPEPAPSSSGVTQRVAPPGGPDLAPILPLALAGRCQIPRRAWRRLSELGPATEVAFISPPAHCLVYLLRLVSN